MCIGYSNFILSITTKNLIYYKQAIENILTIKQQDTKIKSNSDIINKRLIKRKGYVDINYFTQKNF